ncbi:MAG: tocopherol cyclase family protein [Spirochaetaceae bacterium]
MPSKLYRPEVFQGNLRRKHYFEGWYLKHVSAEGGHVLSFIPGISLSPEDPHSFVQYIDGKNGLSGSVRYGIEEFTWNPRSFEIAVGPNTFSRRGSVIDLADGERKIEACFAYSHTVSFPVRPFAPGIMGWYSFVPFMECNHGVVSLHHTVHGSCTIDDTEYIFEHGEGYIEKDWGTSFPESWLWLQCNSFGESETSLMVSVAKIPWLRRSFVGFLAFLYHRGTVYLYTTYNGSSLEDFSALENEASFTLKAAPQRGAAVGSSQRKDGFSRKEFRKKPGKTIKIEETGSLLHVRASRKISGALDAPSLGEMNRRIRESIDARVEVELQDLRGNPLFHGLGNYAGMEVEGDITGEVEATQKSG